MKNSNLADRFSKPTKILAFGANLRMAAIFSSYNEVEKITGKKHQSILKCCKGDNISCLGYYWRELDPELIIDIDEDLDKLTLLDYDAEIGEDRRIYANSKMMRGETILESQYNKRDYLIQKQRKKKNGRNKSKD